MGAALGAEIQRAVARPPTAGQRCSRADRVAVTRRRPGTPVLRTAGGEENRKHEDEPDRPAGSCPSRPSARCPVETGPEISPRTPSRMRKGIGSSESAAPLNCCTCFVPARGLSVGSMKSIGRVFLQVIDRETFGRSKSRSIHHKSLLIKELCPQSADPVPPPPQTREVPGHSDLPEQTIPIRSRMYLWVFGPRGSTLNWLSPSTISNNETYSRSGSCLV